MKTFEFEFEEPIEYAHKGEVTLGHKVVFTAPKSNQRKKTTKLKQMFFRAIASIQGDEPNKPETNDVNKNPDIEGDKLLILMAQSDVDYTDFIETGRSLICDGVGKVDDVEPFTVFMADKLGIDELELMVGEYVANFILRSALKSAMKS